jgi:UPF0271 protein
MKTIDINCDLGESFGVYKLGKDAEIMPYITSANIACGFHAGDPRVMTQTVRLAKEHGVAVGAHPGYPDLQGFGRRDMAMLPEEVEAMLLYQIGALAGICRVEGVELVHVKPHGALYNKAAKDPDLAVTIARSIRGFSRELILVGLAGSFLVEAGNEVGLNVLSEGFADRVYEPDGSLRSRRLPGAMFTDPKDVARHGAELAKNGITARVGEKVVNWVVQTICLHGDEPNSVENARALAAILQTNG